jgi:creatinine amidohydrolase
VEPARHFYLPEMTHEEILASVNNSVLLIPVACMEQHGPHLPIHTDMDNVHEITMGVARKLNPALRALVSPPMWFSPGGAFPLAQYPGTMKCRKETFKELLSDFLESYLRHGFKRILIINGHGGGTQLWIPEVVRYLRRDLPKLGYKDDWKVPADARVTVFSWIALLGEFARPELEAIRKSPLGSDWHGGDVETSLQLYLRPHLVHMDKARKGTTRVPSKFGTCDINDWHREYIIPNFPAKSIEGEQPCVWGDPTLATPELGKAVYDLAVSKIAEFVQEFVQLSDELDRTP